MTDLFENALVKQSDIFNGRGICFSVFQVLFDFFKNHIFRFVKDAVYDMNGLFIFQADTDAIFAFVWSGFFMSRIYRSGVLNERC